MNTAKYGDRNERKVASEEQHKVERKRTKKVGSLSKQSREKRGEKRKRKDDHIKQAGSQIPGLQ